MKRLLIVIDMQKDFITGSLGSQAAEAIVPRVKEKIHNAIKDGSTVVFTRDGHGADYLKTQEGFHLPIEHAIRGTDGHSLLDMGVSNCRVFDKSTFGSIELADWVASQSFVLIELCGVCTDICVVSNALILKARVPEVPIYVDALCCAGTSEKAHHAALLTMKSCQIQIKNGVSEE